MLLAVEDAFESTGVVTLAGAEGVAANHHVLAGVFGEVNVGVETGVDLLVAMVHKSGKPIEVGRGAECVETIGERQVVFVHVATDGADAIDKGVGVAVGLVDIGEGGIAAFRRTIAVEVAYGIHHAVG